MNTHHYFCRRFALLAIVVAFLGIHSAFAQKGAVYLVGAGPGDSELISVKGVKALKNADVVLYDALANQEILLHCRKDVRLIPVGKRAGRPSMKQEEINQLLIAEAEKGNCVVRLKGGDPFVFGRGGEELLALSEANIEVKVVPGITAAIGASAYAGIPLTHRGVSRSFTLVTAGTIVENLQHALEWKALVELGGTIAFYMGTRVVPEISQILMAQGLAPTTPAAIISNGTLPQQKVIRGKLQDFTPDFVDYNQLTPALFLVGHVVEVGEDNQVPEPQPELKVLAVTLNRKVSELCPRIEDDVLLAETFASSDPDIYSQDYLELLEQIGFTHMVFSNTKGVKAYFELCEKRGVNLIGKNTTLITLGASITELLNSHGYKAITLKSYNEVATYLIGDKAKVFSSKYDAVSGATKSVERKK